MYLLAKPRYRREEGASPDGSLDDSLIEGCQQSRIRDRA